MSKTQDRKRLGKALKRLRDARELTLDQLSKESNVDLSTILKIEKGLRAASKYAYIALLKQLQPTSREQRKLDRLYKTSKTKPTQSAELQAIIPLALRELNVKRSEVKKVTDITTASRGSVKCNVQLKGRRPDLTVTVRRAR